MRRLFAVVAVVLALASVVVAQPTCNVANSRIDCKQYSQSTCVAAGCCWSPVNPNPSNLPWCFYANDGAPVCDNSRERKDCGYTGITQSECEAQSCCWNAIDPNPNNEPYCFFSNALIEGYEVSSMDPTATGIAGTLSVISSDPNSDYGTPISPLSIQFDFETDTRAHVKIFDPNEDRWEIPGKIIPRSPPSSAASSPEYAVSYTVSPFGFAVTRNTDRAVLFNTSIPVSSTSFNGLQFKSQFLSLSTQLGENPNLYGFQESSRNSGFRLSTDNALYTLWNHDTPSASSGMNLYGSHPFYMQVLPNGNAHGVLLLNSNGMDLLINGEQLTYNVIGGVLDFYFFIGPTPDDVVAQYSQFVGLPKLETYWSLGFHQCAYGMPDIQYVEQVVANYSAANIPLDTIWSDIDYMDVYKDWTWDPVNYPVSEVANFTEELHNNHQQYVVIVDPGINIDNSYPSYTELIDSGAYIYDVYGNPFEGQVWPGYTIFPDFLNPEAYVYWANQIYTFLDTVPYDGLWIDMNEISNFCNGECTDGGYIPPSSTTCGCSDTSTLGSYKAIEELYLNRGMEYTHSQRSTAYYDDSFDPENPPYAINNDNDHDPLNAKTVDMNAHHYLNILEYDAHNLFGLTEAIATSTALENYYGHRSFVLTRSSFVSSGKWTAHWSGDNAAEWEDMYYSIVNMLAFNTLAMPMIGSDICGFLDDTTEELCSRWIELGSFYPFSRNHNTLGAAPQELYRWQTVSEISSFILRVRYSLLPEYYTLLWHSNQEGTPVIRPLFFEFPTDSNTLSIDKQFLVGNKLMVIPVITEGATTVSGYFPNAVWYDFYTGELLDSQGDLTINAPLDFIPVFALGGGITARHSAPQLTTYETRAQSFNLTVALDNNGQAKGDLYLDDGISLNTTNAYSYVEFMSTTDGASGSLSSAVLESYFQGSANVSTTLSAVAVWGAYGSPSSVTVNSVSWTQWSFEGTSLIIEGLSLSLLEAFTIAWS